LNAAISWFRKEKKRANDVPFERAQLGSQSDDAWQADEREQQYQLMHWAIEQLGKIDKAIVTLYLEDYDYKTIGEMLGISANNLIAASFVMISFFVSYFFKYPQFSRSMTQKNSSLTLHCFLQQVDIKLFI
jgi:hypothetical protein